MNINLTKKDIKVLMFASQYFYEVPNMLSPSNYEKDYKQWKKTKNKLLDALYEMEKTK